MKDQALTTERTSQPRDRSLIAYKAWVTEIAGRLMTEKESIRLTEAEWTAFWREFWKENRGERNQL